MFGVLYIVEDLMCSGCNKAKIKFKLDVDSVGKECQPLIHGGKQVR